MVQLPADTARTVNQTLLFTIASPHDKAGSLPADVAPAVFREIELPAQRETAEAQLS
jgi:hypothetical protein